MAQTVGDFMVERLHAWGVKVIFGYPGDGINGVFGALARADGKIKFIQARHEEMAAFMASAYAKFSGELGVCIATSGPGASHLVAGLYDARLDHMPVLAIAGQQARAALGGHYQQEVDLPALFKDVAGAFAQQASAPAQVRHLVDRAVRVALGERRVTAIVLPNDVHKLEYEPPGREHGTVHSGVGFTRPKTVPYETDLVRAADVLNAGKKVAMLVGAGALGATDEVIAVADRLGAGAAKALLGEAALPVSAGVLGSQRWLEGRLGRVAATLGDASYSLYLLHILVLHYTTLLARSMDEPLLLLPGFLVTVVLSLLTYSYFERPITNLLKKKRPTKPSALPVPAQNLSAGNPAVHLKPSF